MATAWRMTALAATATAQAPEMPVAAALKAAALGWKSARAARAALRRTTAERREQAVRRRPAARPARSGSAGTSGSTGTQRLELAGGAVAAGPAACPGGCDDTNDCTTDRCVLGSCAHDALPVGTACGVARTCDAQSLCVRCRDTAAGIAQDVGCSPQRADLHWNGPGRRMWRLHWPGGLQRQQ